ncbi:MAG: MerR family transcriptional regulator [Candidatus Eremiobacterota bacterium]
MLRRITAERQFELFPGAMPYVSQADAAAALGITTRMIQYWESQELLHPELPAEGRSRRYTQQDLVELRFVKTLVVDQGYSVPSLREKLATLPAPYYYDPSDCFWDLREGCWKSRGQLAVERMLEVRGELEERACQALERLIPGDLKRAARALLDLVRDALEGKPLRPARRRGKAG